MIINCYSILLRYHLKIIDIFKKQLLTFTSVIIQSLILSSIIMRMDFAPLYFPENDGEKTEYMTLAFVAPNQRTGERPEKFQEEGKYLHIY